MVKFLCLQEKKKIQAQARSLRRNGQRPNNFSGFQRANE